ncbi:hypothetical protein BUALT_Bualt08G0123200 [Buddleja alternifolia]|uniref:Leucine-rich repeat domain, L domain-containing protein n=1 Tax=Buddleja alternifolia TaxID=168488 RepID=A0AAV6XCV1_9LAMI|nr:hypothetical protein BUALT_Bualt08G0123200 [Buddleja alternifolia]
MRIAILFPITSLKILRLKQCSNSVVILKPFILPNLKSLYLESFHFDGNIYSFSKEPFSSLTNLEKLTLHRCELSGLTISASKLRILEISFEYPFFSLEAKMKEISAPSLTSFRYEGYVPLVLATDANLRKQSPSPFPYMRKLKLIKRPYMINPIDIVPLNVMNYLTNVCSYGESLVVEFPQGNLFLSFVYDFMLMISVS